MKKLRNNPTSFIYLFLIFILSACGGGGGGGDQATDTNSSLASAARTSVISAGDVDCPNGGILVETGIDENGNGVLEDSEVDTSEKVCHGSNGTNGSDSLIDQSNEPVGANCNYGGTRVDSGLDSNQNNTLDAGEILATTYLCRTAADVPANGFAVTDAWGEVWDGLPRPSATFADAGSTCSSLGARLPTATELHRNNLATGLSNSSISTSTGSGHLWTLIPTATANSQVTVSLADGSALSALSSSSHPFRCVWADTTSTGFDNNACNGKPGSECWSQSYGENIDSHNRLALDYVAASAECALSNASIPVLSDWENLIHGGLPNGSSDSLWSANAMYRYSGVFGTSVISWNDSDPSKWFYGDRGWVGSTESYNFRCVGNAAPDQLLSTNTPACNGDCFTGSGHRSVLVADSEDRAAANHADAASACQAIGADLPNQSDISDLIHDGLPNGSNLWMWISDPMYWYSNGYGNALVRWDGTGPSTWSYLPSKGSLSSSDNLYTYRCVWRQKINDLPVCTGTAGINRVQNSYQCVDSNDGDSSGNAVPAGNQLVDSWGNAWDLQQRSAATYSEADSMCDSLGGRLPLASEVFAVNAGQALSTPIGDSSASDLIWTKTPGAEFSADYITIRVSDGTTDLAMDNGTDTSPYRCVWPSTKGNILSGRSCQGDCFSPVGDSTIIADSYDRPALAVSSAIEECRSAGGRLPDFREMQSLIHQGWENGSNEYLWISESMYWYNGNVGHPVGRWSDTGTADWSYSNVASTGSLSFDYSPRSFRCIYSSKSR